MNLNLSNLLFTLICSLNSFSQSRFFQDSLYSLSLNEQRLLTIYLPENYDALGSTKYPVIYTADGQLITESYQHRMDSLVAKKLVSPFVLIGSHSNETPVGGGMEYRNLDYMRMTYNPAKPLTARFEQHLVFFSEELIQYAESHFQISGKPQDRTFYGMSNGADFGVALAQNHPELIKNYVLLSVFNGSSIPFKWQKKDGLYFYFGYGLKELEHVGEEALRMEKYFIQNLIRHTLITWNGGHDRKEWEATFVEALIKLNKPEDKK